MTITELSGLEPGTELFSLERGPVSRGDVARYATTINDFNPMHLDDEFAKRAGFPGAIAHGPIVLGHLAMMVAEWAGLDRLSRFSGRLTSPTFMGETFRCVGVFQGVREEDGTRYADIELSATGGERRIATALATVRLS